MTHWCGSDAGGECGYILDVFSRQIQQHLPVNSVVGAEEMTRGTGGIDRSLLSKQKLGVGLGWDQGFHLGHHKHM